jgi:two-component system response regulator YesN
MYRILLVDDEILVREAIRDNMDWKSLEYELVGDCQNGKEAIEFIKSNEVDVVLTDICMPFIDGMQLSKFLHNHYPDIAIIILSGFSEFEYAKKAIKYNVEEYILKPVTCIELSEVLNKIHDKLDNYRNQVQKIDNMIKVYYQYNKNTEVIVGKLLVDLVNGERPVRDCLQELQEIGIVLQSDYYKVCAIEIDFDYINEDRKESNLISFAVQNISQEILDNYKCGLSFRDNNTRIYLLLNTNKPKNFEKDCIDIIMEIKNKVQKYMKVLISVGIGEFVSRLEDLKVSFEQAVYLLRFRYTLGKGIILNYNTVKSKLNTPIIIEDEINKILLAIKSNNLQSFDENFEGLFQKFKEAYIEKNYVLFYLQHIIRGILESFIEINAEDINSKMINKYLDNMSNSLSCEEAIATTKEFTNDSMKIFNYLGQSSSEKYVSFANVYMRENYADSNMNLNSICNYLNISVSHFSKIFKEVTGFTFLEVLTQIRMEKAKELLEETNLKIYEIAERVGFSDPHYFCISFKKIIGMTPKTYAKEYTYEKSKKNTFR